MPFDLNGKAMQLVATFFIKNLPYVPEHLQGMELITVFMSEDVCGHRDCVEDYCCIRTYDTLDGLEACDWNATIMKAFPLVPKLVETVLMDMSLPFKFLRMRRRDFIL